MAVINKAIAVDRSIKLNHGPDQETYLWPITRSIMLQV